MVLVARIAVILVKASCSGCHGRDLAARSFPCGEVYRIGFACHFILRHNFYCCRGKSILYCPAYRFGYGCPAIRRHTRKVNFCTVFHITAKFHKIGHCVAIKAGHRFSCHSSHLITEGVKVGNRLRHILRNFDLYGFAGIIPGYGCETHQVSSGT